MVDGDGAELVCSNTELVGNRAEMGGAIVGINGASLDIHGSQFSGNSAILGGGIGCKSARQMYLNGGLFTDNFAQRGGGVFFDASGFVREDLFQWYRNRSADIYKTVEIDARERYIIKNIFFKRNHAVLSGGALDISAILLVCDNLRLTSNQVLTQVVSGQGGGLSARANALVIIRDSAITLCIASVGGGISVEDAGLIGINLALTGNNAWSLGGALAGTFSPDFSVSDDILIHCNGCYIQNNAAWRAGKKEYHTLIATQPQLRGLSNLLL